MVQANSLNLLSIRKNHGSCKEKPYCSTSYKSNDSLRSKQLSAPLYSAKLLKVQGLCPFALKAGWYRKRSLNNRSDSALAAVDNCSVAGSVVGRVGETIVL